MFCCAGYGDVSFIPIDCIDAQIDQQQGDAYDGNYHPT
jgi:hypothetical protein